MGKEAEAAGVEIFSGFPADQLLMSDMGKVLGVITKSRGIGKNGQKKPTFEDSVVVKAKTTVLAEGSRGINSRS